MKYILSSIVALVAMALIVLAVDPAQVPLLRTNGSPEGVVTAYQGQLVTDVSSGKIYLKLGGDGKTGYILLTGTNGAPAGLVVTGTDAGPLFLSGTDATPAITYPNGTLYSRIMSGSSQLLQLTGTVWATR